MIAAKTPEFRAERTTQGCYLKKKCVRGMANKERALLTYASSPAREEESERMKSPRMYPGPNGSSSRVPKVPSRSNHELGRPF